MSEQSLSLKIIRNVVWNFFGQGWMLVVALFATPYIVHHLKVDLYGIYTLVNVIIGVFSFLQLGLGVALIKYISQYLAEKREEEIRKIFWTCLLVHFLMGLLGTAVIAASAQFIVDKILRIPPELSATAVLVLRIGSLGFMISMLFWVISSVPQAVGRFDVFNRIGVIFNTLQILVTVLILKLGFSLPEIIIANIVIQAASVYVYWVYTKKLLPFLSRPSVDKATFLLLLKFGGFVTVSAVVSPILVNIEKIFLTSLRSVAELTYYSVPYALMSRLSIIPSSLASVIFPQFSYFQNIDKGRIKKEIHFRSTLYIFFLYVFFILFFVFFGRQFLALWLGNDFAQKSTGVLIILTLVGLASAMAYPSLGVILGLGKPHLPAIFQIIETVIYIPLAYIFISKFGRVGAAIAWSIRMLLDTFLIQRAACNLLGESTLGWYGRIFYRGLPPLVLAGLLFWNLKCIGAPLISPFNIVGILFIFVFYSLVVWRWGLDDVARSKAKIFLNSLSK